MHDSEGPAALIVGGLLDDVVDGSTYLFNGDGMAIWLEDARFLLCDLLLRVAQRFDVVQANASNGWCLESQ